MERGGSVTYRIKDFREVDPYAVLLEADTTALVYRQHQGPVTRFHRSTDGHVRAEPEATLPLAVFEQTLLLLGYSQTQIESAFGGG